MTVLGIAAGGSIQNQDPTTLAHDLDLIQVTGARWLRVDINWAQIQAAGAGSYNWAPVDAVVTGAVKRGLKVLGVIIYTPNWLGSATTPPPPSTYATFCKAVATHYALGVHAYELWNEQNTKAFWATPSPTYYAALLKAAYPAIKNADPGATVITGGLSPASTDGTNYSPADFLTGMYLAGARGFFDAVGHHPYCFPAMPGTTDAWSAWYQMTTSVRAAMTANGDGAKAIWATEYGVPSNGPKGSGAVTEKIQATMLTTACALWDSYPWGGGAGAPLCVYQHRDQGPDANTRENFFGLVNPDGTPKPSLAAFQGAAT